MERGAYNKSFVQVDGTEVYGLKRRPKQGRFYSSELPAVTFGKDPVLAIVRFAQWRFLTGRSPIDPSVAIGKVKKKPSKRRKRTEQGSGLVIPPEFLKRRQRVNTTPKPPEPNQSNPVIPSDLLKRKPKGKGQWERKPSE